MTTNRRLALLIDGDNAQASLLEQMLFEVNKYGTPTIRRVYGDWTEPNMKSWKEALHVYALQPFQQFRYTQGKNATDSALIIDAMDILYTAGLDGICIASSDSDYTRLATRIREKNLFVLGIGRGTTPRAFVHACDVFVYTENLQIPLSPQIDTSSPSKTVVTQKNYKVDDPRRLAELFNTAFETVVQENGWTTLSALGTTLRQLDPAFDPRTYGFRQLSQLVEAYPHLIEMKITGTKGSSSVHQVRLKTTN